MSGGFFFAKKFGQMFGEVKKSCIFETSNKQKHTPWTRTKSKDFVRSSSATRTSSPQPTPLAWLALPSVSSLKNCKMLKPNGVSHTVYPDQPAESFNDWTANFTRQEVARDADDFKRKFDALWDAFKKSIQNQ